jgi:hypothetical protein
VRERLPHLLEALVLVLQEGASGGVGLLDHLPHLLVDDLGQVLAVWVGVRRCGERGHPHPAPGHQVQVVRLLGEKAVLLRTRRGGRSSLHWG